MKQLRKFRQLTYSDCRLLLSTVFLLGTIRLGLWLLPFPILQRLLTKMTQTQESPTQIPLARVVWAVTVVSRYMPGEVKCLARALATQILLARHGYQAQLRIGVAKGERGQLEAHAWVESQGKIVIGGIKNLGRYTPLPTLEVNS